ncbi:MAG TPA: alkaline phosphatase D family protein [Croceibacterium sp.]
MFKMGPVVSFRDAAEGGTSWNLSILVVAATAPPLRLSGARATVGDAEELWRVDGQVAWRYHVNARLEDRPAALAYTVGDHEFQLQLPASGMAPRIAYASCNGFSSLKAMKGIDDKNALWTRMARQHREIGFNLLMMGGDQVYADAMWSQLPTMRSWAELNFRAGNEAPATPEMIRDLERFYFDLYTSRWAQEEVRQLLASVPTVMMWDDHDLIDGWGSYPEERQLCEVYQQAIWPAAERAFRTFQQHLAPGEAAPGSISPQHGFSFGHVVGGVAILAIDMRSERRHNRVLSGDHWDALYTWLDSLEGIEHLLIMSSIPVVYPGFDTLERILGALPGQQELDDDLRDHWNSRPHKGERLRLIHRLLRLNEERSIRPTLISGDVHVAALGYIESSRSAAGAAINQLISSGIVHPGPPGAVVFALRRIFDNSDEIDRGIVARMVDFPGTQVRFIGKRNYLTIEPDPQPRYCRLWVNWWIEGETDPYTKVVHPLERRELSATVIPQPADPTIAVAA